MLETERLILRQFSDSDIYDLALHRSDLRVMKFLGGIQSVETVKERLKSYASHHEKLGYGMCAMIWKETGGFIGVGGLQKIEDETDVEVGYTVDPKFWRRGIATECTLGCLKHGFEVLGLGRIIAQTNKDNLGSRVVLEKAGMRFLGAVQMHDEDWVRYMIYSSEL